MGAISLEAVVAWFLVTSQYHFAGPDGTSYSWDDVSSKGIDMSRSPQLGRFLTIDAAVLALVAGALMPATKKGPRAGRRGADLRATAVELRTAGRSLERPIGSRSRQPDNSRPAVAGIIRPRDRDPS